MQADHIALVPDPADGAPSEAELAEAAMEIRLKQESFDRILATDDKAAALYAEVKRLNALIAVEQAQKNRYMIRCSELIRQVKALKRRANQA